MIDKSKMINSCQWINVNVNQDVGKPKLLLLVVEIVYYIGINII